MVCSLTPTLTTLPTNLADELTASVLHDREQAQGCAGASLQIMCFKASVTKQVLYPLIMHDGGWQIILSAGTSPTFPAIRLRAVQV